MKVLCIRDRIENNIELSNSFDYLDIGTWYDVIEPLKEIDTPPGYDNLVMYRIGIGSNTYWITSYMFKTQREYNLEQLGV